LLTLSILFPGIHVVPLPHLLNERPGDPPRVGPPRPFFAQVPLKMGNWWVDAAVNGTMEKMPVVSAPAPAPVPAAKGGD
jgi:hypothetical protein